MTTRFWGGQPRGKIDPGSKERFNTSPMDIDPGTVLGAALAEPLPRMSVAPKSIVPRVDRNLLSEAAIAEYRAVAEEIGVGAQDILIEEFRAFLAKHDIPTFNIAEVAAYMDEAAKRDNPDGFGWHWCPVRDKDAAIPMMFGRRSERNHNGTKVVGSDFYQSHRFDEQAAHIAHMPNHLMVVYGSNSDLRQCRAYTRALPLHAMKKIALIERQFTAGQIVFLVSDYATAPHAVTGPDPFLMAVIPNSAVSHGKGRFVIDVWDEPGFGIDRMVK